ncbi:MAG: hypothetical protein QF681_06450 [Vicinamibacterales bacterium]|jgi:hypothetical protein|nr:hypothetical protein [Vicinamibacterales bacterium]
MSVRLVTIARVLATTVAFGALASVPVTAQPSSAAAPSVPRTPDGRPDLQGVWNFGSVTPFQRPASLGGKEFLTAEEASALEAQAAASLVDSPPRPGDPGSYNQFWFARGTKVVGTGRTSLIVDPPDGQLPAYTDEGRARMAAREEARRRNAGPEDRDVDERCILGFNSGPPMLPGAYNNLVQLFQLPGYVVILNEMVNDVRLVPLDSRPALPSEIRQWKGDSRGRWEGDTLVVETRNFRDLGTAHPAPNMERLEALGQHLHLVERFSRLDADTLLYKFTIDDSTAFTRAWSVEMTMTKTEDTLFEYACHEGNYGLYNILAGAQATAKP